MATFRRGMEAGIMKSANATRLPYLQIMPNSRPRAQNPNFKHPQPKSSNSPQLRNVLEIIRGSNYGVGYPWSSDMPKIMDPILPILSVFGYWAIVLGTLEVQVFLI